MRHGPARMAALLEDAGFDSVWVSDHVVFPHETASRYPFAADGKVTWPLDTPYLEPLVVLGAVSAATKRATIGTSVLIAPMRNPVLLAKQAASIDAMSGGRLVLGVGVGWLREEFEPSTQISKRAARCWTSGSTSRVPAGRAPRALWRASTTGFRWRCTASPFRPAASRS